MSKIRRCKIHTVKTTIYKLSLIPLALLTISGLTACATQDAERAYSSKGCDELTSFARQAFLNAQSNNRFGNIAAHDAANDVSAALFQSDNSNRRTAIIRNYNKKRCTKD